MRGLLASSLKACVRDRQLTLGSFMTFDFWPGYLQILKVAGMDFVVLDMEHGSCSLREAEELCRTARLLELPLVLRPEAAQYHVIRKYLDMGPAGLMIPWVETQDQVDAVRDALFVPPRGRRGPGGPAIFANRTLDRKGWEEIETSFFVMMQVETPAGIANLASIAAPEWVDAIMPGPYDLSLNLGPCGELDHPQVAQALQQIRNGSQCAGKPCGMVVGTAEQARNWIGRGIHFLIVSEPVMMVRSYVTSLISDLRRGTQGAER
jgi:2-keto-3-deoxy-L-rhamnonate aldolase RhmA